MPSTPSDPLLPPPVVNANPATEEVLTLAEERVVIDKQRVNTGGVRVVKSIEEHPEEVKAELIQEEVSVERIPMNQPVEGPLPSRTEGNVTIVPVVEEVIVVEKRYVLREEIRVTRSQKTVPHRETVSLLRETAEIVDLTPNAD